MRRRVPSRRRASDVLLDEVVTVEHDRDVGAPRAEHHEVRVPGRERDDVSVDPVREHGRRPQELPGQVRSVGLDDDGDRGAGVARCRDALGRARIVGGGRERTPCLEQAHGLPHLLLEGALAAMAVARDLVDPHGADGRGAAGLPPGPGTEVGRGHGADALGGHGLAPRGVDLARVDEPLGAGRHERQRDLELHPAVVVLAAQVQHGALHAEVTDARGEREIEQLGESGADLPGVGIDRVATGEHEVERPLARDGRGERACRRERVGSRERRVGDEHAVDLHRVVASPGERLAQHVVGGRRAEREHGDRAVADRGGELDRL